MMNRRDLVGSLLSASGAYSLVPRGLSNTREVDRARTPSSFAEQRNAVPLLTLRPANSPLNSAKFSPNGSRIVTTDAPDVSIWNAHTGEVVKILKGHRRQVYIGAFSPDGQHILTASSDGTARVWDAETGETRLILQHRALVRTAAFDPLERYIATVSSGRTSSIWDAETGTNIAALPQSEKGLESAAFSQNGEWILTTALDDTVRISDLRTGQELQTFHIPDLRTAALSPDGKALVTTSLFDRSARIRDTAAGGQTLVLRGHIDDVLSAVFSFDGEQVLTASLDGTARIWNSTTGCQLMLLPGAKHSAWSAVFSRDAKRALVVGFDEATLWNVA